MGAKALGVAGVTGLVVLALVLTLPSAAPPTLRYVDDGIWSSATAGEPASLIDFEQSDASKTSWSPDGTEIAYACDPEQHTPDVDGRGLCSASPDGTHLWTTAAAPVRFPTWSSDGDGLAYAALGIEGHGSLWVTDRDTPGEAETLCEDWCPLFRYYSIAWSPDGETVAAVAETPGTGGHPARIILFDVETHEFELLNTQMPGLQHGPTWSPDGEHLAFSSTAEGDFDVWRVDLESRTPTRLTHEAGGATNPTWAPDGSRIVFVSRTDGGGTELRSVAPTGGESSAEVSTGRPTTPLFVDGP